MKTGEKTAVVVLAFYLFAVVSWVVNIVKLFSCDFEPSYKEEIIHALGLMPFISLITAWL